jgi:hypothetical protein
MPSYQNADVVGFFNNLYYNFLLNQAAVDTNIFKTDGEYGFEAIR